MCVVIVQTIGSGFVIAPLIGLVETIAIGKAFGKQYFFAYIHACVSIFNE